MSRELKGWLFQPKNGKGQVSPYWTIQFYKYDPDQGKTVRYARQRGSRLALRQNASCMSA